MPEKDIAGIMSIEYNENASAYDTVMAQFTIEAESGTFTAYLQDKNAYPIGRIVLKGKKIISSDIPMLVNKNKFFKFWPYLFSKENFDSSKIQLIKRMWEEHDGVLLPGQASIKSKKYNIYIKFDYAD